MATEPSRRGRRGEHAVYFDHEGHVCTGDIEYHRHRRGRWRGAISVTRTNGTRVRRKFSGTTKTVVRTRLKELEAELDRGLVTLGMTAGSLPP